MSLAIASARATAMAAAGETDNPFVAWDNMAARALAVTSDRGVQTDGALLNAAKGTTWSFWKPTPAASTYTVDFRVQLAAAEAPDFVGLFNHNVKAIGATGVSVATSANGTTWNASVATLPASSMGGFADGLLFVAPAAQPYLRVRIEGIPANAQPIVAGVFIGKAITLPQRLYQGFEPAITPTEVDLMVNDSDGGQYLGSSVVRRGSRLALPIAHVDPTFLRGATWKAFQTAWNEGKPAFVAWRPTKYPDDLHYGRRDGQVLRPVNSGPRDLMSFTLEMRAYEK